MRFDQPSYASKSETEQALASSRSEEIVSALVGAALEAPDRAWVEALCLKLVEHPDAQVRRAVATAGGHLARIHHALDPRLVQAIERLAEDRQTAGVAGDALDDIRLFLGLN